MTPQMSDEKLIAQYFDKLRQSGLLKDTSEPRAMAIAAYIDAPKQADRNLLWAFDSEFYLSRHPDVMQSGENPLVHFIQKGWREGRSPHPLIDMRYLSDHHPQLAIKEDTPLAAFLATSAEKAVSSHPLFDADYYASQQPIPSEGSSLRHFLSGKGGSARPHRLFIPAYYRSQIPSLARETSPLLHYLSEGWKAGLKPHPDFDTAYYLSAHPDVADAGVEPLTHYVEYGQLEDRNPSFTFHSATYRRLVGFGKTPRMSPLEHKLIYNR